MGVLDDLDSMISFTCPRCHRSVEAQFYGPCPQCHGELRSLYRSASAPVEEETVRYEPRMNVTPNAVALKDD